LSSNGRALSHALGVGITYSGIGQNSPGMSFSLDPGAYVVTLSQQDVTNPATVTLTDNYSNTFVYSSHGVFDLTVGSRAQSPFSLSVKGGIVDFISIQTHMQQGNIR
jgi:hypothetical protein